MNTRRTLRRPILGQRRAQAGVTLVESMVTASVLAVVTGLTVPGFEASIQRRHLEGAAAQLETDIHHARMLAVARNMPLRISLMVSGLVALRKNIAAALPGRKLFCPILRSRLRMFIDTSPKSIFTGQGARHLWHTVQWSATSSNSCQCLMLTPRRVCSS